MFDPEYTLQLSNEINYLAPYAKHSQLDTTESQAPLVNHTLLWLQAICQLFRPIHLPTAPNFPSIQTESRPAALVMAGNRYLNQCRMNGSSTRTRIR